jgi:hypothetical protein
MNQARNVVPFPDDNRSPGRRPNNEEEFWQEVATRKYPKQWAELFYLHMEENDWTRANRPVKNWKRCMYLWYKQGYLMGGRK